VVGHEQVRAGPAGCDRGSAVGQSDNAILLMLTRLERAADIDWWTTGDGARKGRPGDWAADVGSAIADYLMRARPRLVTAARNVFITVQVPCTGSATSSVTVLLAPRARGSGGSLVPARTGCTCDLLAVGAVKDA
jgi:hypothetical protein